MRKIALILIAASAVSLAACESEPSFPIDDSNSVTNVVDKPEKPEPCRRSPRDLTACP
jgi:hypothetical protein